MHQFSNTLVAIATISTIFFRRCIVREMTTRQTNILLCEFVKWQKSALPDVQTRWCNVPCDVNVIRRRLNSEKILDESFVFKNIIRKKDKFLLWFMIDALKMGWNVSWIRFPLIFFSPVETGFAAWKTKQQQRKAEEMFVTNNGRCSQFYVEYAHTHAHVRHSCSRWMRTILWKQLRFNAGTTNFHSRMNSFSFFNRQRK